MSITSAIVLYVVLWFLTFLIVIPIRLKTQGDVGEIVPGTMAGAPHASSTSVTSPTSCQTARRIKSIPPRQQPSRLPPGTP